MHRLRLSKCWRKLKPRQIANTSFWKGANHMAYGDPNLKALEVDSEVNTVNGSNPRTSSCATAECKLVI
jgi:hypothetical protein